MAERSRWSAAAVAEWGLVVGLAKILSWLPQSWAYAVGEGAGRLACRLDRRHRAVTTENLAAAFPGRYAPAELDRLAEAVFENLGRTAVDIARADRLASRADAAAVEVDGLEHLLAARARGKGVLVVLNDEIHAARDVVKTATYRVQTFRSLDFGALGHVDGDGVHFYRAPTRPHMPDTPFAARELRELPRVDIVYCYAGADGALVEAAVKAGAKGLVSAGFAPGIPTPAQQRAFEDAAKAGTVVVQCSRAFSGRIARRRHLREAGIIAGEDFSPQKARILLMLMLAAGEPAADIQNAFSLY
jgi:hypothetical protein